MISELAIWQELGLLGLALLSLLYVFYFRIWVALAIASDLLFASALAVCIASIAIPAVFDSGAQRAVEASPLPAALLEADAKVAALETLPQDLIARALEKVGYERDSEADAGVASESDEANGVESDEAPEPGPFESGVRPAVEALVSALLRGASGTLRSFYS